MRLYYLPLALCLTWATSAFAGVFVSAPSNNSNVATTVQYVATANTSCSKGIAAMGIYTAPGKLAYKVSGAKINTLLTLSPGTYHTVVQEWDHCGWSSTATVTINVGGSSSSSGGGNTFTNLHQKGGWQGYALLPTSYAICSTCKPSGPQLVWWRGTGTNQPSSSSIQHHIGGSTQYADALWNNHLIGDFSSQGLHDYSHTLIPSLHNFTYDVWFYVKNIALSQALEFDINQFFGGKGFIWGHECRIAGGHEWDIWDNVNTHWVKTGIPCNPIDNAWNHLVLQVQRTSNNQLLFKTITLNGKTATLNRTYNPGNGHNWYGVTVNYQQDGNKNQAPYDVYIDKFNFSYN
jgi:hypothetical protein